MKSPTYNIPCDWTLVASSGMPPVDFAQATEQEKLLFSEDLVQLRSPNGYIVDVGWSPHADKDGSFVVRVVKGNNWAEPVFKISASTRKLACMVINMAIEFVEDAE